MYTCGPTVYAPAHIGNLRTFVVSDWWRRTLKWNGYQVESAMNVTDVDDKTIKGSREAGLPLADFTSQYKKAFFADLESLNIKLPNTVPHATEHIKNMIEMIEVLLAKDFAYQVEDGIYFRIDKSNNYGLLAGLKKGTGVQPRIKSDQYDKETPSDFALWKFWQEADGEVAWAAPFGRGPEQTGRGRPGWHIECSAMIRAVFGDTIDLHLGGTDLIFPHHTNEIAQSEAVTGKPLANHWLHIAFVNMASGKMAKSEGNVVTLANLTARGFSPLAYRYWLLSAHYRTLMNFSWEALEGSATAFKKLQNRIADLVEHRVLHKSGTPIVEYLNKFTEAINNDLNLPVALSVVWQLLDDGSVSPTNTLATIFEFDKVLGLDLISATKLLDIPLEVTQLLADRESARQAGDFARADSLRQQITTAGYTIDDTSEGPKLRKI
ncbi:MAG: cysteine--tRNA ligase, partial [Candidatus Vogelbacteria bacterium]